jgi:hypothetical protein
MALFIMAIGLALMSVVLLALPLLGLAKRALPIGSRPPTWIHGREIDGFLTDRRVEELIREELYGKRLNVSRGRSTTRSAGTSPDFGGGSARPSWR